MGNPARDYKGLVGGIETWNVREGKGGHQHRLWATVRQGKATLWLASNPQDIQEVINNWKQDAALSKNHKYIRLVERLDRLLFHGENSQKATIGSLSELEDVRKAVLDYQKALTACKDHSTSAAKELTKRLSELRKQHAELEGRLKSVIKVVTKIQEYQAKACFAAGTK